MFGFLKKKFGKSVDEAKPVEQTAEEQAAAGVPAEDLAGVQAPVEPPVETPAVEDARGDTATVEASVAGEPLPAAHGPGTRSEAAALPESVGGGGTSHLRACGGVSAVSRSNAPRSRHSVVTSMPILRTSERSSTMASPRRSRPRTSK